METTSVGTGREAVTALRQEQYDCVILDLNLPDLSGFDLLKQLDTENLISIPPVIVYTGKELDNNEQKELEKYTSSIIIKGVKYPERLLDETTLFLHRVIEDMPKDKQQMIASLYGYVTEAATKKWKKKTSTKKTHLVSFCCYFFRRIFDHLADLLFVFFLIDSFRGRTHVGKNTYR